MRHRPQSCWPPIFLFVFVPTLYFLFFFHIRNTLGLDKLRAAENSFWIWKALTLKEKKLVFVYSFTLNGTTGVGISKLAWAGTLSLNSQDCCLSFQAKIKLHEELWNFSIPQSCSVTFFHHFKEVLNSMYSKGIILWGTEKLLGSDVYFQCGFFSSPWHPEQGWVISMQSCSPSPHLISAPNPQTLTEQHTKLCTILNSGCWEKFCYKT